MTEQNENPQTDDHEEFELNHTDKLVGIFTEPGKTFKSISNFPLKTTDWIIPILLLIVITIFSSILMMNNPIIKADVVKQQTEQIQQMVEEGTITQAQADAQINATTSFMEGPVFIVIQAVMLTFGMFFVFFIVTGTFYLLSKYLMKGEGAYKGAMVAYGLPMYIGMIQAILVTILALSMDKLVSGTNLAIFLEMSTKEIGGFLLSKVDPLSIWFYVVFGIGLAKLFNSKNSKKYVVMVLAVWIVTNLVLFALAQSMPMLGRFIGMS